MVVQGILALALALPTGLLFGVGYGTGVRIGYEQVYPLLFPQDKDKRNVTPTVNNIKQINGIYNAIGGKEASQMGIAMGLQGAMEEIDRNPDFQALEALELRLSGRTQQRLGTEEPLKETSISDFPLGSSLDPKSPNFNADYYIQVKKEQQQNAPLPRDLGDASQLNILGGKRVTATGELAPALTKSVAQAQAFTTWQKALIYHKSQFLKWRDIYLSYKLQNQNKPAVISSKKNAWAKVYHSQKAIATISNDYRNPNNGIRTAVLELRQDIANKKWKRYQFVY